MYKYDIGIVIVNYNVRYFLEQCLYSVRKALKPNLKVEVWVVDNASVDGSVSLLQSNFPDIHLIANEKNVGFSAANNQAIRMMDSKYVLLLNPDTILEEDTLDLCYRFMEQKPEAGAMGVRMIDGAGNFLPESKRKVPDLWNSFCKLTYLSDIFPKSKTFSGYNLGYLPEMDTHQIEVLCGAFMFMRKETLDKSGLLDEAFFMYGEDIDLSYRILQAGYQVWYYPETSIIHYKGESTKKGSINYVKTFYGAMQIYVNKHYGQGNARIFKNIITAGIYLRAVLSAFFKIIKELMRPVLDLVLLYFALHGIKMFWANFYFKNPDYYTDTSISYVLAAYSGVWIFVLWILGHYDEKTKIWSTIKMVLSGTLVILTAYALLPEAWRSSRAIILLGTISACLVALVTGFILKWLKGNNNSHHGVEGNIAIVAQKENGTKLKEIISSAVSFAHEFYFFAPANVAKDSFYTNDVQALPEIVRTLKIKEIIYSSEDMSMKKIMQSMSAIGAGISFKIGGDDALSIIGSSSKHHQGAFYTMDMKYAISDGASLRLKRILDIFFAVLAIVFFPILYFLTGFRPKVFSNATAVLIGDATWIGYGGDPSDYNFLPLLPKAIIPYATIDKVLHYSADHHKIKNTEYAKEYYILKDISLVIRYFYKMGD
jgi:GT2 family glycosyltransferase